MLRYGKIIALALLTSLLAGRPALAGCTNPAGNEADLLYSNDYHTYQFCNGTSWLNAGAVQSPDTIGGAATFGDTNVETGGGSGANSLYWAERVPKTCELLLRRLAKAGLGMEEVEGRNSLISPACVVPAIITLSDHECDVLSLGDLPDRGTTHAANLPGHLRGIRGRF